jgi:hypothetical protein
MISKVNGLLSIGYSKLVNHLKPKAKSHFHTKMTGLLQANATVVKLNEGKDHAADHPLTIEEIRKAAPLKWPTADEIGVPTENDPMEDSLPGTSNGGIGRSPSEGDEYPESEVVQIRQTSESPPLTIEDIRNSEPLKWPTAEEINAQIDDDPLEE